MRYIRDLEETAGIHCKTEEEAKAILALAHKEGLKWVDNASYISKTEWDYWGIDTVYFIQKGTKGSFEKYSLSRQIYPASDFLEESTDTNIFMFKKISNTKWITNKIQGVHLIATYLPILDKWRCSIADSKELQAKEIFTECNSLEDVCLCLERNQNPLHDMDWEDGFYVDYETVNTAGLVPSTLKEFENVQPLVLDGAYTKKIITELSQDSITLPKVHVPKKFKTIQFN